MLWLYFLGKQALKTGSLQTEPVCKLPPSPFYTGTSPPAAMGSVSQTGTECNMQTVATA